MNYSRCRAKRDTPLNKTTNKISAITGSLWDSRVKKKENQAAVEDVPAAATQQLSVNKTSEGS